MRPISRARELFKLLFPIYKPDGENNTVPYNPPIPRGTNLGPINDSKTTPSEQSPTCTQQTDIFEVSLGDEIWNSTSLREAYRTVGNWAISLYLQNNKAIQKVSSNKAVKLLGKFINHHLDISKPHPYSTGVASLDETWQASKQLYNWDVAHSVVHSLNQTIPTFRIMGTIGVLAMYKSIEKIIGEKFPRELSQMLSLVEERNGLSLESERTGFYNSIYKNNLT
jgi:hypothetical protein